MCSVSLSSTQIRQLLAALPATKQQLYSILYSYTKVGAYLVVDVLGVAVLHPDPPTLGAAVQSVAPLEGRSHGQHYPQHRARDGLSRDL